MATAHGTSGAVRHLGYGRLVALREHTQLLNALRTTQVEHAQVLGALLEGQQRQGEALANLAAKQAR